MGLVQSQTTWWYKAGAITAAAGFTSGWYNLEVLNAAQFFLKYTGSSNVAVFIDISPADAYGRCGVSPGDALEAVTALAAGANNTEGFFFPASPTPFDRPFASGRVRLTATGDITSVYFAMCSNAAPPG